jgi:ribosomal subunit interface protein
MEIIFKGRQTDVPTRFRDYATAKLEKLEKLDQKTIIVDVEVSVERNPRQSSQKERVELTIWSRGPAIRAEAAAEDRFAALDLALGKLDSRLRRALDRRKNHYNGLDRREADRAAQSEGSATLPEQAPASSAPARPAETSLLAGATSESAAGDQLPAPSSDSLVPIETEGDCPVVVRQKFHHAKAISIDQALLEMELVGHDFYLFHDADQDMPSVVYRRHGYQYGVIRLVEQGAAGNEVRVPAQGRGQQAHAAEAAAGRKDSQAAALQP